MSQKAKTELRERLLEAAKKGKESQGKREMIKHLEGGTLTLKQSIMAKHFDCMGGFRDAKVDCGCPDCPLYGSMPYRTEKRVKKILTDAEKKTIRDRFTKNSPKISV